MHVFASRHVVLGVVLASSHFQDDGRNEHTLYSTFMPNSCSSVCRVHTANLEEGRVILMMNYITTTKGFGGRVNCDALLCFINTDAIGIDKLCLLCFISTDVVVPTIGE